jgi:hypothetical protein
MPYIYISIYLVWEKLKRNKKKNQKEKPARQQLSVLTKEKNQLINIHPVGGGLLGVRLVVSVYVCLPCRVDRCERM